MTRLLIAFLASHPDNPVPYPWQRFFDIETGLVLYKNLENGCVVIDLRNRVNLGHGLFHNSNVWNQLTGRISTHPLCCRFHYQYDHDHPFLVPVSCCCGPLVYVIVPERSLYCPICGHSLHLILC